VTFDYSIQHIESIGTAPESDRIRTRSISLWIEPPRIAAPADDTLKLEEVSDPAKDLLKLGGIVKMMV
jgi:hypothetical protein